MPKYKLSKRLRLNLSELMIPFITLTSTSSEKNLQFSTKLNVVDSVVQGLGRAYQGTEVPRYWGTEVLRYRGTEVPRYWGTKVLRYLSMRYQRTEVPRYWGTKVLRYQGTKVPSYWGTKVLRYQGTEVPRYWGTKVLRYRGTEVPQYKVPRYWGISVRCTEVPRYWGTKVWRYQGTEVSRYQSTEVPRYWGTKVWRYRGIKVPKYWGTKVGLLLAHGSSFGRMPFLLQLIFSESNILKLVLENHSFQYGSIQSANLRQKLCNVYVLLLTCKQWLCSALDWLLLKTDTTDAIARKYAAGENAWLTQARTCSVCFKSRRCTRKQNS